MLIVIAIIGILVSFLFATFGLIREKARQKETRARVRILQTACQNYKNDVGGYPHPAPATQDDAAAPDGRSWVWQLREWGYKPPYFDARSIRNEHIWPNPVAFPAATNIYVMDGWGSQTVGAYLPAAPAADDDAKGWPVIRYWRRPHLYAPLGGPNIEPFVYATRSGLNTALAAWRGEEINIWSCGPNRADNSSGQATASFAGLQTGGDDPAVTSPDTDGAGVGDDIVSWGAQTTR
ncbi:MAG: type II secretion system protein [Planctomycetes bacterium]|nr:type II secretion system protein [Planctomycetota bacterium]